jgi:hypothetical protein
VRRPTDPGPPQGSPVWPLGRQVGREALASALTRRGHRCCRDADDGNLSVRSRRAGERGMAKGSHGRTSTLRRTVNGATSAVARPAARSFRGCCLANDGQQRRMAPQALTRLKRRVRDRTRRTRGVRLPKRMAPWAKRAEPCSGTAPAWSPHVAGGWRRRVTDGGLANGSSPGGPTRPAQRVF